MLKRPASFEKAAIFSPLFSAGVLLYVEDKKGG